MCHICMLLCLEIYVGAKMTALGRSKSGDSGKNGFNELTENERCV